MVIDGLRPIAQVARELGLNEATLGNWVNTWKRASRQRRDVDAAGARSDTRIQHENRELRMHDEFPKKQRRNFRLRATVSDKYELIDAARADFPITKMRDWLEVSKSGYYEWRDRQTSGHRAAPTGSGSKGQTDLRRQPRHVRLPQVAVRKTRADHDIQPTFRLPAITNPPPKSSRNGRAGAPRETRTLTAEATGT